MNKVYCSDCGNIFEYDISKDCPLCHLKGDNVKIQELKVEINGFKAWKRDLYKYLSKSGFDSISNMAEVIRKNEKQIAKEKVEPKPYKTNTRCICDDTYGHEEQLASICPKCILEYLVKRHPVFLEKYGDYKKG